MKNPQKKNESERKELKSFPNIVRLVKNRFFAFLVIAAVFVCSPQPVRTYAATSAIPQTVISKALSGGRSQRISKASGNTASGSTASAGTASGSTASGGSVSVSTVSGSTASAGTAPGSTASAGTASGSTASAGTASGSTASAGTASGSTASAGTASGSTASAGTASGSTASGNSDSGRSDSGCTCSGNKGASADSTDPQTPASDSSGAGSEDSSLVGSDVSPSSGENSASGSGENASSAGASSQETAQNTSSASQPLLLITRSDLKNPVSSGETLDLSLNFKNMGSTKMISPAAYITSSDALTVLTKSSAFLLPDLAPGESTDISLKIKAAKEITSASQAINIETKFNYQSGDSLTAADVTDHIGVPANTSAAASQMDPSIPNVIVSSYTYDGSSVAAGNKFRLNFTFTNTGSLKIENIVATADGGENFAMDGTTNSFFYSSLEAGASQSQEIPMQALSTAKTGAQPVGLTFKYEFTDGQKRSTNTADIKISVPVVQPDRFQLIAPAVPSSSNVDEELALTLAYVNKGKGDISNVEASVDGNDIETPAKTQYIGNVTAGTSGNIGFAITPKKEGDINLTLKVTYEDANQQVQTKEFPITLHAVPAEITDIAMTDTSEKDTEASFPWGYAIAGVIAAVCAAVFIFIKKRKKKASDTLPAADGWDDWDVPEASEKPQGTEVPSADESSISHDPEGSGK